jgi:hypothetical protein
MQPTQPAPPTPSRHADAIDYLLWLAERLRLPGGGDELMLRVLNHESQAAYFPPGMLAREGLDRVELMLAQLDQLHEFAQANGLPHQIPLTLRGLYVQLALLTAEYEQFVRIINTPAGEQLPSQQFLLRCCQHPGLVGAPAPADEPAGPFRVVTLDTEVPVAGSIPTMRRVAIRVPDLPEALFGSPLLAAFDWRDCAAFNRVCEWVEQGKVHHLALQAASQELADNLIGRLRAAWPEHFAPATDGK